MNFTLDQLLALDAIARTGSFAAAAKELHKVPSAISYLVAGLESVLEVEAFDRSRRKAVLTKSGQRILEASREVIERAQALDRVPETLRRSGCPHLPSPGRGVPGGGDRSVRRLPCGSGADHRL